MPTISKDLVNHLNITEADAGQRLDNYLIKVLKGVPKSHIQRIIRAGEVRLNKKRCKGTDRLTEGDVLRIPPIRIAEKQRPSESSAQPNDTISICSMLRPRKRSPMVRKRSGISLT